MDYASLKIIADTLQTAGYTLVDCSDGFLCIQDPTCIWETLEQFLEYARVILTFVTVVLLAGWGITMVRGAPHDMVKNIRTLFLIFGTLSVALPAVNVIAGKNIVDKCQIIKISHQDIQELLNEHPLQPAIYEEFDIKDSAFDDFSDQEFNF